eukprot:COSAG05_NODE_3434_length_2066_cov_4.394001_3_plen_58_part_00
MAEAKRLKEGRVQQALSAINLYGGFGEAQRAKLNEIRNLRQVRHLPYIFLYNARVCP